MKLDKENTRQIIKIVIVAIVLLAIVLNLNTVWNGIKIFLRIISPFIWGLAIAFILNIFMTFYENIVFKSRNKNISKRTKNEDKKIEKKKRHKRTFSIILSIKKFWKTGRLRGKKTKIRRKRQKRRTIKSRHTETVRQKDRIKYRKTGFARSRARCNIKRGADDSAPRKVTS